MTDAMALVACGRRVALVFVLALSAETAFAFVSSAPGLRAVSLGRQCQSRVAMQAKRNQYAAPVSDPYRALGLTDRKASSTLIRQAYMSKAKVCHPDVNDSPEAAEEFRKISDAYERLMDENKRLEYDNAWMQMRAGVRDAEIVKPPTPAQAAIIALAGAVSGAPVVIPLTLAHFCVEPFASAIKSMSTSCNL